jgi:hypothetical protein
MQGYHGVSQGLILTQPLVRITDTSCGACAGDETWIGSFQSGEENGEEKENGLVVLPSALLVTLSWLFYVLHLHAVEVAGIKIRAFGIVHPGNLILFLWSLR